MRHGKSITSQRVTKTQVHTLAAELQAHLPEYMKYSSEKLKIKLKECSDETRPEYLSKASQLVEEFEQKMYDKQQQVNEKLGKLMSKTKINSEKVIDAHIDNIQHTLDYNLAKAQYNIKEINHTFKQKIHSKNHINMMRRLNDAIVLNISTKGVINGLRHQTKILDKLDDILFALENRNYINQRVMKTQLTDNEREKMIHILGKRLWFDKLRLEVIKKYELPEARINELTDDIYHHRTLLKNLKNHESPHIFNSPTEGHA